MGKFYFIFLFIIPAFILGCGDSIQNKGGVADSLHNLENRSSSFIEKTIEAVKAATDSNEVEEFIFGSMNSYVYMFNLKRGGKNPTLYFDNHLSYFHINFADSLIFDRDISSKERVRIAESLLESFPDTLLRWKPDWNEFGCPGCNDGSWIYAELVFKKTGRKRKRFEIDLIFPILLEEDGVKVLDVGGKDSKIPKVVMEYARLVRNKVGELYKTLSENEKRRNKK